MNRSAAVELPGRSGARTLYWVDGFERDGLRVDVRDRGPRGGAIAVLLHGFPQDATA